MLEARGWGLIVPVAAFVILGLVRLIVGAVIEDWTYCDQHSWPTSVALWLAAICLWRLGKYFNGPSTPVGDETQKQVLERLGQHTFFWVPIQGWSLIFLSAGAVNLVVEW